MTKEKAKKKAYSLFSRKSDYLIACILINDIYSSFSNNLDCENKEHEFTVSTTELCNILEHFKKKMLQ